MVSCTTKDRSVSFAAPLNLKVFGNWQNRNDLLQLLYLSYCAYAGCSLTAKGSSIILWSI